MSSQEVVDYVNQKIEKTPEDKLSDICEEVGIKTYRKINSNTIFSSACGREHKKEEKDQDDNLIPY